MIRYIFVGQILKQWPVDSSKRTFLLHFTSHSSQSIMAVGTREMTALLNSKVKPIAPVAVSYEKLVFCFVHDIFGFAFDRICLIPMEMYEIIWTFGMVPRPPPLHYTPTGKPWCKQKIRIMARRTSIDWLGKYRYKETVKVMLHDAVRVTNGGTGVVRFIGPLHDFLNGSKVVGVLMDQWHPFYTNGMIDDIKYFESDDGRGYFAHPEEIAENWGSTVSRPI